MERRESTCSHSSPLVLRLPAASLCFLYSSLSRHLPSPTHRAHRPQTGKRKSSLKLQFASNTILDYLWIYSTADRHSHRLPKKILISRHWMILSSPTKKEKKKKKKKAFRCWYLPGSMNRQQGSQAANNIERPKKHTPINTELSKRFERAARDSQAVWGEAPTGQRSKQVENNEL